MKYPQLDSTSVFTLILKLKFKDEAQQRQKMRGFVEQFSVYMQNLHIIVMLSQVSTLVLSTHYTAI